MTVVSVGIDVGGTFTDLAAVAADGSIAVRKVPTTASDQSEGVERALRELGADSRTISRIVHGTTVATNTLLQRTGARVVLCCTRGATDVLLLRTQERASLYDLTLHHPAPLVASDRVVAVKERLEPDGVLLPPTSEETWNVAEKVALLAPDAVVVSLLHAYDNPSHERALARALRERLPGVEVIISSDVHPEIREYERTSTAVAEGYLRKGVAHYLTRLTDRFKVMGLPAPGVMLSSGGMRPAARAAQTAAALALSGPAGGVLGAAFIARTANIAAALSIDIGGTSADVGLIIDGQPFIEAGGSIAGVPIALPRVLVETVSAGGGSIGWVDSAGVLRVGPRSAGMTPGPACFGRGGTQPTVTDAHLVLGNIVTRELTADVRLDAEAARRAVQALGSRLGESVERVATAMIAIADAEMARALRRLSVDRGIDPRNAVLIPFGGGGPLHACGLADSLGIRRVLVPPHAGVLSAVGLAIAAEQRSAVQSVMRIHSACDAEFLDARMQELSAQLEAEGGLVTAVDKWWARCRYRGQGHELECPLEPGHGGAAVARNFTLTHRARYGFTLEREVEIVSIRGVRETAGPLPRASELAGTPPRTVRGRAVVPVSGATMLVALNWTAEEHESGRWMLQRAP